MSASAPGESAQKEGVVAGQTSVSSYRREVDIRALKRWVASKFGSHSLIGKVILEEPDIVPVTEIVGKVGTWLAVLREDLEGLS
ncbi:MAG: hypothetical protein JRN62_08825 [Nitrososphaerota archaeon]|jgi:hypothetical protein|nr:hypothetical protein [Nitrososphaerota archaeon]